MTARLAHVTADVRVSTPTESRRVRVPDDWRAPTVPAPIVLVVWWDGGSVTSTAPLVDGGTPANAPGELFDANT